MNQRKLYHTIESFASVSFKTGKELLQHVVNEIVQNQSIDIKGGRIWEYDPPSESYRLIHQIGQIQQLDPEFSIRVDEYPMFLQVARQRSLVARETHRYLKQQGIVRYSATGVGEKLPYRSTQIFRYILAFNSDTLDQSLLPTLGIISVAVTSLLGKRKLEQKARLLAKDIDRAAEIQQSILPEPGLHFHHYDIYGMSRPDRIVGGDFFDYLLPDAERDRLVVVIGDAASKGLKAAAQALYVVGAIRMGVYHHTKITVLMSRMNELVHRSFAEEQFVSMFYAEFVNDRKGLVLYSSAGHNSPLLYRASDGSVEMLDPTGQLMGPFPSQRYGIGNTLLHPGDVLVLYTDGISEVLDVSGELYGEKRFPAILQQQAHRSAEEICNALIEDVRRVGRQSGEGDDRTVVVVKRNP